MDGSSSGYAAAGRVTPSPAAAGTQIRVDRVDASDDTDVATRQTVEQMCAYIRESAKDPYVRACADYAWRKFGLSSPDLAMKAWAAFWWVKHCLRFRSDEATMFRVDEQNQQDLLISPSVLFRMKDPAEDCDGFTMAEAVLLHILGVPVAIATVAATPADPQRWSHVFPVAIVNGSVLPLDASHGSGPGWMVPPEHIFRWQAWDLDARPVNIRPMRHRGLHGYVRTAAPIVRRRYRRRGMGDTCYDLQGNAYDCAVGVGPGGSIDTGLPPVTSSSPPGSYLQWGTPGSSSPSSGGLWSFLTNLVSQGANVASRAVTPITTVTYPGGATVSGPAGSVPISSLGLSSAGWLLPVGIGVVALLVVSAMGKRK